MTPLRTARRAGAVTLAVMLVGAIANVPVTHAITQPFVDPAAAPGDGPPKPEQPMRQSNMCIQPITVADPNVAVTAPGFATLNVAKAWQYSTGNGVTVAVIDTGVNPSPRLPVIPGGDYIMSGDGLLDCDAHGTIVASLIGAAPLGSPMPAPMPAAPAVPPPPRGRRPGRAPRPRAGATPRGRSARTRGAPGAARAAPTGR